MRRLTLISAVALLALVAVGAFWGLSRGGDEGAEAQTQVIRWVNATIEVPSESGLPRWFELPPGAGLHVGSGLEVGREPGTPPRLLIYSTERLLESHVAIDAETGEIVFDNVQREDREAVDRLLSTLTVSQLDEDSVGWPYNGEPPDVPPQRRGDTTFIPPDPSSGILVTSGAADPGGEFLEVTNGRSVAFVDVDTGVYQWGQEGLAPEDDEVLQRFLDAANYKGDPLHQLSVDR